MFQSLVEGRQVGWDLLTKDVPEDKKYDLEFIVDQLDWEKNVDPYFKKSFYMEPVVDPENSGDGYTDRWIDYKPFDGKQMVTAKEITVESGAKCVLKDPGASAWIFVQGSGSINGLTVQTPAMIHFGEEPDDEFFVPAEAAAQGIALENTGTEPLVALRYFGPDVHEKLPQ